MGNYKHNRKAILQIRQWSEIGENEVKLASVESTNVKEGQEGLASIVMIE